MAKKAAKVKKVNSDIPPGFEVCDTGGDFAAWHDFEKNPVLQGKVEHVRSATLGKGKDKNETRILTVSTPQGSFATSESFKLRPLFDIAASKKGKGKEVYIKFLGMVKLKGGRKMRDYIAAIK
jgi:hypothetical protein